MPDPYLAIGEILRPRGIAGEMKVKPLTDDPHRFLDLKTVFLSPDGQRPAKVLSARVDPDSVALRLEGVDNRDDAEKLRGLLLYVSRADAVPLPEDANFIVDLIGCRGIDENGRDLGTLVDVMQPGGNDVYVFQGPLGEVLVPALKRVVLSVDIEEKIMRLSARGVDETCVFED